MSEENYTVETPVYVLLVEDELRNNIINGANAYDAGKNTEHYKWEDIQLQIAPMWESHKEKLLTITNEALLDTFIQEQNAAAAVE